MGLYPPRRRFGDTRDGLIRTTLPFRVRAETNQNLRINLVPFRRMIINGIN
jgi:hypothetical protein